MSSYVIRSQPLRCTDKVLGFHAYQVFETLYQSDLEGALAESLEHLGPLETSSDVVSRTEVVKIVKTYLLKYFHDLVCDDQNTTSTIHMAKISRHKRLWSKVHSDATCFYCIRRIPQYRFQCGHSICENCVQIAGKMNDNEPWIFRISSCFLCGEAWEQDISITINAPTRGFSMLCMDGGGTKAIIPLALLKRLEEASGLPLPIQRHFNVIGGVSSGKLPV